MNHLLRFLIVQCLIILVSATLYGQEVIATAGDYAMQNNSSLSWTIGEGITETFSDTENILNQGFQQTGLTITEIEKLPGLKFEILAFPNPTKENVILKIKNGQIENLQYEVCDMSGKVCKSDKLKNEETEISFINYKPSIYLLKVFDNNNAMQTFKIILK